MAMNARHMRILRGHGHVLRISRPHGFEKVLPLIAVVGCWFINRDPLTFAHFAASVSEKPFVPNVKALRSEEAIAAIAGIRLFE
jgi:hypothetical protein